LTLEIVNQIDAVFASLSEYREIYSTDNYGVPTKLQALKPGKTY
jgi:hypothetical protein